MELSEFVENTIQEIIKACNNVVENNKGKIIEDGISLPQSKIEFDIMVTTQSETGKELGGGVKVLEIINVGGKGKEVNSINNANRIKFTIPITLPHKAIERYSISI